MPESLTIADLHSLLKTVSKPAQYLGNEVNAVHKDFSAATVRVCLVFPDAYEIGMSHMGQKILYDILNNIEGVVAERCFAPLPDMEKALREHGLPLFSLESKTPLSQFDIIGISLPYELTYTNALNIIELGGIPLWQKDRGPQHPIILGGGTCSYNPEPIADFFDAIAIGDGEEVILEIINAVIDWKRKYQIDRLAKNTQQDSRDDLLERFSKLEGLYIPSFFTPEYNDDGTLKAMHPLRAAYTGVKKRIVQDLNAQPYPTKLVIPNIKLVHDRIGIEIQRGCTRMCRFCQAGYIERPTRQRSPERVLEIAETSYAQTGIDEISLLSLSAGDYNTIVPTLIDLNKQFAGRNVAISVPATRTETLTPELIEQVKKVRMSGFTIAPEAGSERMRRVINKGNKTEDLMQAAENAFSAGYRLIKFYYMCGLPFEMDEDLVGIADEAYRALKVGTKYGRTLEIKVSVSSFVPKPFTPFQWEPQMGISETRRKHDLIKRALGDKRLRFKNHDARMSYLEGIMARGDRRISKLLEAAFKLGARMDEWSEHFDFTKWEAAIAQTGTDTDFYVQRRRAREEVLPWDHLFIQMEKAWLWNELEAAKKEAYVADCSLEKCAAFCGVCDFKIIKNKVYVIDEKPLAAKKGNREWYGRYGGSSVLNTEAIPVMPVEAGMTNIPEATPVITSNPKISIPPPKAYKYAMLFTKTGPAAYYSHLELMEMLKRAILRSGYQAAYSQGFHPQMKLSMGPALSMGMESLCETCEIQLFDEVLSADLIDKMNLCLPDGLRLTQAALVDLKAPSVYSQISSIRYRIRLSEEHQAALSHLVDNLQALERGEAIEYVRKPQRDKPEKRFLLNEHLHLPKDFLSGQNLEFSTRCTASGSLGPIEALTALTGGKIGDTSCIRVTKIGVSLKPFLPLPITE